MTKLNFKQNLTNYYYFIIINSFVACVIGIIYWFPGYTASYIPIPKLADTLAIVYSCCIHFLVLSMLTFVFGIITLPTIYLSNKIRLFVQSTIAAIFIAILFVDTGVFYSDAMHLSTIDINTISDNLDINALLKTNKIIAYCCWLLLVVLIYYINLIIVKTTWFTNNKIVKKHLYLVFILTIIPVLIYFTSNYKYKQQLLTYTERLPFCGVNNTIVNKVKQVNKTIAQGKIRYPLKPLETKSVNNPPNILIIAIDAWRADCFNEINTPNLWKFAKQGKIFSNHFSGGNHTYLGLFSLFYSIPANYFNIFKLHKMPAIFFYRIKQLNYQINCFNTNDKNHLLKWYTDEKKLHVLNAKILDAHLQDQQLTIDWLDWYNRLDKTKPWFSFIFYYSIHEIDFPESYSTTAKPSRNLRYYKDFAYKYGKGMFINSYKTCVHYLDSLANQILQQLKDTNDLTNTIVIITADHGLEWDDNDQGNYGYMSNFTNSQIQVPLAIIYPQHDYFNKPAKEDKLTTHYDIVPTLMQNFLGITNNITDYSIGVDLLSGNNTNSFMCTQKCQYGFFPIFSIIEKNNILRINPNGSCNLLNKFNQIIFDKINNNYLNQALEQMTRFIKK
jgi:membrane-anchored protein YejM (alkaline phosphatase superfamily)